jgi:outer membrane protein OmpA-like peptidoglycan-associated protein
MRKISLFLILILTVSFAFSQEQPEEKPKKGRVFYQIEKAYAYVEEELVISRADLYCSYFIGNQIPEDILIVGAEQQILSKKEYTDTDKMFINKGTSSGLNEGDRFLVLEKGKRVKHPFTHKKLGWHYMKKSLAEITCIYENKAVITLEGGCFPVKIGDFLLPLKQEETVFKRKIDYNRCHLPEGPNTVTGTVIFQRLWEKADKRVSAYGDYVIIDAGMAHLEKGNYVIFYTDLGPKLPPIICGAGIVVNAQNTTSTVKILDSAFAVESGCKAVLVPPSEEPVSRPLSKGEDIPLLKGTKPGERTAESGEQSMEVGIQFEINKNNIDAPDKYAAEFEKVKEFISSKSQYVVILRGYSCSIGGLEYNLKLSQERVENVKAYLVSALGIPENFIKTYYYGEKDAPYDNTSEEQRRKNRLVNIQVIGK